MADNASRRSNYNLLKYSGTQIFIVVSVIFIMLLLDTSIIRLSDLTLKATSSWPLILFITIAAISLGGQNLILRFIKRRVDESTAAQKSHRLNTIYKIAVTVHYVLAAILVFVILQMLIASRYNAVLLTTSITISYTFAIAIMAILCHRFFSWFRLNKNYVISLYGLSSIILAANACITLSLVISILSIRTDQVMPHVMSYPPIISANPVSSTLNYAYTVTTIASFIITWCATVALLKNYIQEKGKFMYRVLLIVPLAYFVSQFLVLSLGVLGPVLISNPVFYGMLFTIMFALSKPIGGVIFGIGFWLIARNIRKDNIVRSYLVISAYGFMLLFASNQALVLTFTQYPPFGLATISFVGFSSYLVLLGIYSSAIAISHDANLRREIRHLAIRESKMLDGIGLAQIEDELRRRVVHIAKIKKTDLSKEEIPSTLNEEDVNQYLDDVIKEIKTIKKEGLSHK
jgi:hypothetical protein